MPRSDFAALEPAGRDRYGGEMRGLPVLLLGVAAAHSPAGAGAPFVPLSEATAMRVCARCDGRLPTPRTGPPAPLLMPAPYTPAAPARWVGTPRDPGPFPPKPPALS